jgi:hypothetical protein
MEIANTNITNFPLQIKQTVDKINNEYDKNKEYLQYFQYITREYLVKSQIRGLLVYAGVGTGKSITAAAISDYYRKHDPHRKIIILLSKSLQSNFENNIKKYMRNSGEGRERSDDFINDELESKYTFISLNAANMFTQISRVKKTEEEVEFNKQLGKFNKQIDIDNGSTKFLENSLLIVDEAHNLFNSITNNSKNAINLYKAIMNTRNIKLVFLTGTPIINNPFELVPCFNMLKGYIFDQINEKKSRKHTLFPENQQDFQNFFISKTKEGASIKNKDKFQNRIFGLVSYYGDYYFDKKAKEGFPEQKETIIDKVPMSLYQFGRYQETRDIENKEESNKFKKSTSSENFSVAEDSSKSSSSYRIRSRQVSNYFIPEYALTFKSSRTSVVKYLNKITVDDLKNLDKFSPKFKKIIENIDEYQNKLGVVYSEFVSGEGLALFSMVLEKVENYVYWTKSNNYTKENDIHEFDITIKSVNESVDKLAKGGSIKNRKQKTYAMITGDVIFSDRQNIINVFNSKKNMDGSIISLLLISKSGAEGLNLRNVRHLHIMEPFWNYARIEQVIARGVRFQSHNELPEKERNLQPYIYISTYPKGHKTAKERTTDEEFFASRQKIKR